MSQTLFEVRHPFAGCWSTRNAPVDEFDMLANSFWYNTTSKEWVRAALVSVVSGQVSLENLERDAQIFLIFCSFSVSDGLIHTSILFFLTVLNFTCFLCSSFYMYKDVLSGQFMALQKLWYSKFCITSLVLIELI